MKLSSHVNILVPTSLTTKAKDTLTNMFTTIPATVSFTEDKVELTRLTVTATIGTEHSLLDFAKFIYSKLPEKEQKNLAKVKTLLQNQLEVMVNSIVKHFIETTENTNDDITEKI